MIEDLHIRLQWLEESVTPEKMRKHSSLSDEEKEAMCWSIQRQNSVAAGITPQEVDELSRDNMLEKAELLYHKYAHYLHAMEK